MEQGRKADEERSLAGKADQVKNIYLFSERLKAEKETINKTK